jgi:hypothetical protein
MPPWPLGQYGALRLAEQARARLIVIVDLRQRQ